MSTNNPGMSDLSSQFILAPGYAIFAAVALFASIFAIVFFRSRMERRQRHAWLAATYGVGDEDGDALPGEKPQLFDAHLLPPDTQMMEREWDAVMVGSLVLHTSAHECSLDM
ncbi:hypothetical protein B0H10DRAFT_1943360 [Mycena sp. CBHHK59/15]|nr:hypothetical protein B0H10DRAFT_1943360 [Mycena sp. CBHHK59/15]